MNDIFNLGEYLHHYLSLLIIIIIITLVSILLVGILGHLLSNKTNFPSIIFFMFFEIILGKYGLNLINPDVFDKNGIKVILICVAIIVFEGYLLINLNNLRKNFSSIINLITLNVLITIVGLTYVTYSLLGIDFKIALLYSSLVLATDHLESETILVYAVGVIAVASIFNYITLGENQSLSTILNNIFSSLFLSALIGLICVTELALKFKEKEKATIIVENNLDKVDKLSKLELHGINGDATSTKLYKEKLDLKNVKSLKSKRVFENFGIKTINLREATVKVLYTELVSIK
ncbi:MAG: hypothetical protein KatS3mg068_1058 [Candidatus Sericytochromatia bacterium]|nr:MAG: hypothetical protein KatS3mg068_1058 [Candidatus Sericytochromatia bacterium]